MVSGTYDKDPAYDRSESVAGRCRGRDPDARIPQSSRNPEMDGMVGAKPRLLLLNKADMADPAATSRWISAYRKQGFVALGVDCRSGKGISGFAPAVREQLLPELWNGVRHTA